MTNLTINKEVRNGVEFWVSTDASEAGMSLSGLNVMIPCHLSTLAKLVDDYSNAVKMPSQELEDLRSNGLTIRSIPNPNGGKQVKFIPAELCAAFIEYFALDAKRVSTEVKETALNNMRLFNKTGMKMFILNQVGYKVISPEQKSDSDRLDFIISEMQEMKELTKRYVSIKENTRNRPGLDEILNNYEQGYLLSDGEYFTLGTWLAAKGLQLTHGQKISFGMAVHATFKTHGRQQAPTYNGVRMYCLNDIALLEAALKNI